MLQIGRVLWLVSLLTLFSGCASRAMPTNTNDLCSIFKEKPHWYRAAKASVSKWGGPMHVPMAIIYQESAFRHDARPSMNYFLGVIPTGRKSNAYGYSQALEGTWAEYQRAVRSRSVDRDDFADAIDFVFWFMQNTYQRNGVSKWDAYAQYLNYHEGQGGYSRGSHLAKKWLINTANRVAARARQYATQLATCQVQLDKMKRGWF